MRPLTGVFSAVALICWGTPARAGIVAFTDLDKFLEAAGDVHVIDFETLPDGSPSYFGAEITPDFNYTSLGVEFFSHAPRLLLAGHVDTGFRLRAGPYPDSEGPRNWLTADLLEPATAIGILFGGGTTLTIANADGTAQLATRTWGGGGMGMFLGFVSDIPIGSGVIDRGYDHASADSFFFTPVPEPSALALVCFAGIGLLRRRVGRAVGDGT